MRRPENGKNRPGGWIRKISAWLMISLITAGTLYQTALPAFAEAQEPAAPAASVENTAEMQPSEAKPLPETPVAESTFSSQEDAQKENTSENSEAIEQSIIAQVQNGETTVISTDPQTELTSENTALGTSGEKKAPIMKAPIMKAPVQNADPDQQDTSSVQASSDPASSDPADISADPATANSESSDPASAADDEFTGEWEFIEEYYSQTQDENGNISYTKFTGDVNDYEGTLWKQYRKTLDKSWSEKQLKMVGDQYTYWGVWKKTTPEHLYTAFHRELEISEGIDYYYATRSLVSTSEIYSWKEGDELWTFIPEGTYTDKALTVNTEVNFTDPNYQEWGWAGDFYPGTIPEPLFQLTHFMGVTKTDILTKGITYWIATTPKAEELLNDPHVTYTAAPKYTWSEMSMPIAHIDGYDVSIEYRNTFTWVNAAGTYVVTVSRVTADQGYGYTECEVSTFQELTLGNTVRDGVEITTAVPMVTSLYTFTATAKDSKSWDINDFSLEAPADPLCSFNYYNYNYSNVFDGAFAFRTYGGLNLYPDVIDTVASTHLETFSYEPVAFSRSSSETPQPEETGTPTSEEKSSEPAKSNTIESVVAAPTAKYAAAANQVGPVQTGDSSDMLAYGIITMMSSLALAALLIKRQKRQS